ncbi:MAG: hypothetical protein V5A77_05265, partial [Candidatus Bipolaricaulota bacterium]
PIAFVTELNQVTKLNWVLESEAEIGSSDFTLGKSPAVLSNNYRRTSFEPMEYIYDPLTASSLF